MPGFDRTGPLGDGPLTGGGFGPCGQKLREKKGRTVQRYPHRIGVGRGGRPYGGGRGNCFGGGRGPWGWHGGAGRFRGNWVLDEPVVSEDLEAYAKELELELEEIRAELQNLKNHKPGKDDKE